MAKIGRNELCHCGSGLKYKRCCLQRNGSNAAASPLQQLKISLVADIEKVQRAAQQHEETVRELGVFILWSNREGDAWLLEVSESDAVQVARDGEVMEAPIDENPETIEVNWSHSFAIRDRQFFVTTYAENEESCIATAPTKRINAAIRRIKKKYSEKVLNQVHVSPPEPEKTVF